MMPWPIIAAIAQKIGEGLGGAVQGVTDSHNYKPAGFSPVASAMPNVAPTAAAPAATNPVPTAETPNVASQLSNQAADQAKQAKSAEDAQAMAAAANSANADKGLLGNLTSDKNQKENITNSDYQSMRNMVGKMKGKNGRY